MGKASREKRQRTLAGIVRTAETVTLGQQKLQQEHAEQAEQLAKMKEFFYLEFVGVLQSHCALAADCRAGNVPSTESLDIIIEHCDRALSARRAETE